MPKRSKDTVAAANGASTSSPAAQPAAKRRKSARVAARQEGASVAENQSVNNQNGAAPLTVWCCTFNVGEEPPPTDLAPEWVKPACNGGGAPDVCVFGFQEADDTVRACARARARSLRAPLPCGGEATGEAARVELCPLGVVRAADRCCGAGSWRPDGTCLLLPHMWR